MFARGNSAAVLSQTYTQEPGNIHSYFARQGIVKRPQDDKMIPLNPYTKYGRRLNNENRGGLFERRGLQRLNSAPELHKPELPPILSQSRCKVGHNSTERRHRPLTPLVVNSNHIRSTKNLPMNYRINLDLVPLIEVGTGNLSISRRRQPSQSSSDSCFSSSTPSPNLKDRSDSPIAVELKDESLENDCRSSGSQRRANSVESLEEVDSDDEELADGKDTMILRWLQTVEKSHETTLSTGELLPCIKEGKLA